MRLPEDSILSRILVVLLPAFIALSQRVLSLTIRRRHLNREALQQLRSREQPYILGIWHASVLWAPFFHRKHGIQAMVSPSRDGELIARVVEWSGNHCIRGSSNRGGTRALMGMVRMVRNGSPACVVPDGPLGPPFECKGGIISIAQKTGIPIIPFHYEASRQWVARKAWDKHRIPKPFSVIYMSYGDPIYIPSRLSEEQFEEARKDVEQRMLENMRRCQQAAGHAPGSDL